MQDTTRATLSALADALDDVLAEDAEAGDREAVLTERVAELEAQAEKLKTAAESAESQALEFAGAHVQLEAELKTARKELRQAQSVLEAQRQQEVVPRDRSIQALQAEVLALHGALAAANDGAIAYRVTREGCPDLLVQWRGTDKWSITNGAGVVWSINGGWIKEVELRRQGGAMTAWFTREQALKYAREVIDAMTPGTRERNPQ